MIRVSIIATIDTLDETIADFEGTAFILPEDSKFGVDHSSNISTYSFHISPQCVCDWLNCLTNSPCGYCKLWDSSYKAVAAIAVGFSIRGWSLAADLMWHNLSRPTLDSHYTPTFDLANRVAQAPQILNEVALDNNLTAGFEQKTPERLNGFFANTIEGDVFNAIGKFYYAKSYAGNGNVNISIIDRYDWDRAGDSPGGVLIDVLVQAQEI